MIEFSTVSREIRSLVSRRRELLTFLGSVFAALGIFLQNALHGDLPESLRGFEEHVCATYAFMLLVPSLILALRLAKLHAGMTINGILYARLEQETNYGGGDQSHILEQSGGMNVFGLSFMTYLLASFLAGFSSTLFVLATIQQIGPALGAGTGILVLWLLLYLRNHLRAAAFGRSKAHSDSCAPFSRTDWEAHLSGSLEDTNHDMISVLAVVGLIVFSAFESLSGLGKVSAVHDVSSQYIQSYGPQVYGGLMAITCFIGLIIYLRLRLAVGGLSLQLDPTDRPFRPLRLTDSLLGYALVAFLFTVSIHFLLFATLKERFGLLLGTDAVVFCVCILVEQFTLVIASRRVVRTKL